MSADGNSALEALKKKFAASMPGRLEKIDAACKALPAAFEEEAYMNAYRLAHNLKGASGTYGFPKVSEQAAELEALLKGLAEGKSPIDDAGRTKAGEMIGGLQKTITEVASKASA